MLRPLSVGLTRLWLLLRYRLFSRRYNRLVLEQLDQNTPLLVLPHVFNPILMRTGQFMAHSLTAFPLAGKTVLDLGTGSGIGAIFAAQQGARQVVAGDINPHAVRCARLNSILNQQERLVRLYCGNLLEPLPPAHFDIILFNPPFYRGPAKDPLDQAWRGEAVFERFVSQLPRVLKPEGVLLLLLSSHGNGSELLGLLTQAGYQHEIARQQDFRNEIITLYQVRSRL